MPNRSSKSRVEKLTDEELTAGTESLENYLDHLEAVGALNTQAGIHLRRKLALYQRVWFNRIGEEIEAYLNEV